MSPSLAVTFCLLPWFMISRPAYVSCYGLSSVCQYDQSIHDIVFRRFLTFYSIQFIPSLFRTRMFFRCSTFLTHVIITFMLYALSVHWAYCSAVVSFMFLTAGTEDLDLSKRAGSVRTTLKTSSSWILHAYLTFDWMLVMIFFISVYVLCRCLIPALVVLLHM